MTNRAINSVRYIVLAISCFVIGAAINGLLEPRHTGDAAALFLLIGATLYAGMHISSAALALVIAMIVGNPTRSKLYLILSIIGFLAASWIFQTSSGIHIYIIFWANLVLISLDYFWRNNRKDVDGRVEPGHDELKQETTD